MRVLTHGGGDDSEDQRGRSDINNTREDCYLSVTSYYFILNILYFLKRLYHHILPNQKSRIELVFTIFSFNPYDILNELVAIIAVLTQRY